MSKTNRIKIPLPTLATRDEAEAMMTSLAASVNAQRQLTATRDAEILAVNKSFESAFSTLELAINLKTDALRVWADANPDQFPKGRKSIEFVSGLLGFRTGTPKLALLNRSWSWDKVLATVRAAVRHFIRTKEEVDKDAILSEYAQHMVSDAQLATYGVKVTQEESFYIEPALTETATRQVQTEAA